MWEHVAEGVGHRPDPPGGRKSVRDPSAGFLFDFCLILLDHLRKINHWSILGKGMRAYTYFLLGHLRQIDHWSILGKGMRAYTDVLLDHLRQIDHGSSLGRGNERVWCFSA